VAKAKAQQQEEAARQLAQAQLEHCKVQKALKLKLLVHEALSY
jgi:hypothetical protein